MKSKNITIVSIFLVLLFILIGAYMIISSHIDAKYTPNYNLDDFYPYPEKKLGVNEYQVVTVSEQEMIKTHFDAFVMSFFEDIDASYSHIENDWGLENYPNIRLFKEKIITLTDNFTYLPEFHSYAPITDDENKDLKIYKVKDKKNNVYVFTIEAVMKYTVRFE